MLETARSILNEIDRVLTGVDQDEVYAFVRTILAADTTFVHGLGREGLVMRGFAMRLMHLGLPTAVVGDMTTPPVDKGDLFLVSCGPGYLSTVDALTTVALDAGATVAMITSQPEAALPQCADLRLTLPAQTMAEQEGSTSQQAMGSVFEQAMWILLDSIVPILQAWRGQHNDDLRRRHTNLE